MMIQSKALKLIRYKALGFLFIPLVLILVEGQVRESISDYAYSESRFVRDLFVALLIAASTIYVDTSVLKKQIYEAVLAISLAGVALTPHKDYFILHYVFSGLFFFGNCFNMIHYAPRKYKFLMIFLASLIIIAIALSVIFSKYSILVAETIGMIPMVIYKNISVKNKHT